MVVESRASHDVPWPLGEVEGEAVEVVLPEPPTAPGLDTRLVMLRPCCPRVVRAGPGPGRLVWPRGARGPGGWGATGLGKVPRSAGPGAGTGAPRPGGPCGWPWPPPYMAGGGGEQGSH